MLGMKVKQKATIYIVRGILILLTALTLWFIFSNASADGETSSNQSYTVTVTVQEVVGAINPSSPIATATGEEFDLLHDFVRKVAHATEYFALGLFAFGTYLSFVGPDGWHFAYITPCFVYLTAATDEYVQTLAAGRAAEFSDLCVDCTGALVGMVAALCVYGIVCWIIRRRRKRANGRD